jgi:hypothetical protein
VPVRAVLIRVIATELLNVPAFVKNTQAAVAPIFYN